MHRVSPFVLSLAILLCAVPRLWSQSHLEKDTIVLKGGKKRGFVSREERDWVYYKSFMTQREEQRERTANVRKVIYFEMTRPGLWKRAMENMAAGQYAIAAARFEQMASTGDRRWQKIYGLIEAGNAWEAARDYKQAAEQYGQAAAQFPEDRRMLNSLYWQGICLARAGDYQAAEGVAEALRNYSEANNRDRKARRRAEAVMAAAYGERGDMSRAIEQERKVVLSSNSSLSFEGERAAFLHWNLYWADLLRNNERFDEAALRYKRMLDEVSGDSALMAKVSLGYGVCLARAGAKEKALFALLKMDALPYGSGRERAEAQYWAGRLFWETAQEVLTSSMADGEDNRVAFAKEKEEMARQMLKGVAMNSADPEIAAKAEEYLNTNLPPDPDEEEPAAEEPAAEEPADGEPAATGEPGAALGG